ncbi:MAG: hypothetical protein U9N61_09165, partial [Euryarchaeota archaeon]|nr:hypothetical protein [Euryarchaeota archaeon]
GKLKEHSQCADDGKDLPCLGYILLSCVFARTGGVNAMHVIGGASCIHILQNFNKGFEPKS